MEETEIIIDENAEVNSKIKPQEDNPDDKSYWTQLYDVATEIYHTVVDATEIFMAFKD